MDEWDGGQVAEAVWKALGARDWEAAKGLLHDDFVQEWPQSGERIVGRKVAFTSQGTMTQFGVTESAFGTILSGGVFADGDAVWRICAPGTNGSSESAERSAVINCVAWIAEAVD